MESIIYSYFSTIDTKFEFKNQQGDVKKWNLKKGAALYIGVDNRGDRHENHLKPSKKHLQAINTFIQENPDGYAFHHLGTVANKKISHEMEIKFIQDYQPLFNIYGNADNQNNGDQATALSLKDLDPDWEDSVKTDEPNNNGGRFNTLEKMAELIPPEKMAMFTHRARRVVMLAAKDTGKSFPVELYKFYGMERDPMASGLTLHKHSTGATSKGNRSMAEALTALMREGYKFPNNYEPSTGFYYRLPKGKKGSRNMMDKLNSQFMMFSSFEDSNKLSPFPIANGGYPFVIHIEEPALEGDKSKTPERQEWESSIGTIWDSVYRKWRTYNHSLRDKDGNLLPHKHAPIPLKEFITMNDWEPEHPVSQDTETYHPQRFFLDWALGFAYSKLLSLWEDKIIDSSTPVPELKEVIDEKWEEIKESVVKRHTQMVYVEKNKSGIVIDTLFVRMQKFANPQVREIEESREMVFNDMYRALITGDSFELAKAFGMGYDGSSAQEKAFNFKKLKPYNTDELLKEEGRQLLGFVVAWDHDANRGPLATPMTISGKQVRVSEENRVLYKWKDVKFMIHEQVSIEGYGKGKAGENTKYYHEVMRDKTLELNEKYVGNNPNRKLELGKFAIFDDDDGSYVHKFVDVLLGAGFDDVDSLATKNGAIELASANNNWKAKSGFGKVVRREMIQLNVDTETIVIDKNNTKLLKWLKMVPKELSERGDKYQSTGKWGGRFKDISDSFTYCLFPFRRMLYFGIEKYLDIY